MNVEIKDMPEMRAATVHHTGPYNQIGVAFARLGQVAGAAGLLGQPGGKMLGIYYDDPRTTPAQELRSDAAVTIAEGAAIPAGLGETRIPAGRYACTVHIGPYDLLPSVWDRLIGEWLPSSGHRVGKGASYELYLNTEMDTPEKLETALYFPIE